MAAVGLDPEQGDDAVFLCEDWPADEGDVVEPFEFYRAVDRQVGTGAPRQLSVQSNLHQHRPVLHRGIDAGDVSGDHPNACIYRRLLADLNVPGLRFRDA